MKALIFGCNGYIGRHISCFLSQEDWDVRHCDIEQTSVWDNYTKTDITDKASLANIDFDVDVIFWFSGLTGTLDSFSNADSFIDVNERGLVHLLTILKERKQTPRIIYPSTRLVYKGSDFPLTEDAVKETRTVYAVNKLAGEAYLEAFNRAYDIPFTIYRICVPYGNLFSTHYSYGTIGFFLKKALQGDNITLYGDGSAKRTFTHITDLCRQIIDTCTQEESQNKIFNIGGEVLSLKEAATVIANYFKVSIEYSDWPEAALRLESGHTYFDDMAIRELLGDYKYMLLSEQNWR